MKKSVILSIVILSFSFIGFAQEITFSLVGQTPNCSGSPSYFEFDIMASSSPGVSGIPTTIFNNCVIDIQYPMTEFFGDNVSNGGVVVTLGSDCSGTDYATPIATNLYDSVIEITLSHNSSPPQNGTVLDATTPKAILHIKLKINNCATGSISFTTPSAVGLPSYYIDKVIDQITPDSSITSSYSCNTSCNTLPCTIDTTCNCYLSDCNTLCNNTCHTYHYFDDTTWTYTTVQYGSTNYSPDITSVACPPSLDNISQSINAGTNAYSIPASSSLLTLTGYNFGSVQGLVQVLDANQGTIIFLDDSDVLSWSDNQIQIKMPSVMFVDTNNTPGTGPMRVFDACSTPGNYQSLEISYNISNARTQNHYKLRPNIVKADGSPGSYIFRCDTSISHNPQALICVKYAIAQWNCYTGVNWILGSDTVVTPSMQNKADGISVIYFSNSNNSDFQNNNKLMVTHSHYLCPDITDSVAFSEEADINIRMDLSSGKTWCYDTTAHPVSGNIEYFYNAILHELGHAHLLGHVNDASALMYRAGSNSQRKDITSASSTLYGAFDVINTSMANAPSIFGCGSYGGLITSTIGCIDHTLGVSAISKNQYKLNIFPNPASIGDITIVCQLNNIAVVQFKIMDCTGREVMMLNNEKKSAGTYTEHINIDALAKGIYLFIANINGEYQTVKFIKL